MLRKMVNGQFYQSVFDTDTGTLVRIVDNDLYATIAHNNSFIRNSTNVSIRKRAYSPSPETVDIAITNWCNFGCTYCYQNSTVKDSHASKELVETVLKSFKHPPYQIAIGGGEPTSHPDFTYILHSARSYDCVPNYTTAGHIIRDDVIKATNSVCGGVAITYHSFMGTLSFKQRYSSLSKKLNVQLNIHLITLEGVSEHLQQLIELFNDKSLRKPDNIVLLAYDSKLGRANKDNEMSYDEYSTRLPLAILKARDSGLNIAYSDGLIAYFISRPELGLNTAYNEPSEGHYSCYFDKEGNIHLSSFDISDKQFNVYKHDMQSIWENGEFINIHDLYAFDYPSFENCGSCNHFLNKRCAQAKMSSYRLCAYANHNRKSLKV